MIDSLPHQSEVYENELQRRFIRARARLLSEARKIEFAYLGSDEWNVAIGIIALHGNPPKSGEHPILFGFKLIRVMEESHFGVSA